MQSYIYPKLKLSTIIVFMLSALYQIFITPLVQLTEFFYSLFFEVTGNQGIAVIGLSFVVTIFTLPLYMVAGKWQKTERNIKAKLKPGVERIKTTFKGDEQYMILTTFYKQLFFRTKIISYSSYTTLQMRQGLVPAMWTV